MPDETEDLTRALELDQVLADYVAAEEAGQPLDRQALLARYPQLAAELREFFANRDQMQRLAAPLRGEEHPAPQRSGALGKIRYFGDYELLDEIAAGGMGVVYRARQVSLNRIVAVKMILKGTLASEEDVKRFRAEAEAAANLQHPAIVAIHEVGLHEGQHYFSMDFVEGPSLAELPRQQPLSARQAAEYVRDAAEAVHYAHQQGTLHRDLKPSNILIDKAGRVRITDFGLAKRIEGNSDLTLTGQILGTPSYMPPEQASGKRSLIGAASDIYALGAVLYDLLTGRPPFRGESPAETLRQVESLDPLSPRLLNPTTPRDLETICLKCLEKEPHKRYGTAQLLADDLGRYLGGEPIVARPVRTWQRAAKWIRRHPTAAGLVVTSALALVAMAGLVVGQSYNARLNSLNHQLAVAKSNLESRNELLLTTNGKLESASKKLTNALDDVKAERGRANRYLYAARMALVQRAEREEQPGRVIQLLRSVIPESPDQEDLRDFEWFFLWRKHQGEESRLRGHTSPVSSICFSTDNQWIASGSSDGTIKLWKAAGGQPFRTLTCPAGGVSSIEFIADNQQVAARSGKGEIFVWDFTTGALVPTSAETLAILGKHLPPGRAPLVPPMHGKGFADANSAVSKTMSADGVRTVTSRTQYGSDAIKSNVTVSGSKIGPILTRELSTGVTQVALSDDGETVAVAGFDQDVRIWDLGGREIATLHAGSDVRAMAFSSDTSRLVAGNEDGTILLWSLPGRQMRTIHQGTGQGTCVAFGAGGRLLAAVAGQALVWDVASGKKLNSLAVANDGRAQDNRYRRIAISPTSGRIIGVAPGNLFDALSGRASTKLSSSFGYGYAFSADESLVAEASLSQITAWETATGKQVHSFKVQRYASCVAFSPDNQLLAGGTGTQQVFQPGSLQVWNVATGQSVLTLGVQLGVWGLAFSPDGKLLAAAMGNYGDRGANVGRVCIWDVATWRMVLDLRGHTGCVWSVAFNPSGSRLASAAGHWGSARTSNRGAASQRVLAHAKRTTAGMAPGEVILWDVATGHELLVLPDEQGGMYSAAFSPDGRRLATASKLGAITLLDGTPLAQSPTYEPLPNEQVTASSTITSQSLTAAKTNSTLPPYSNLAQAAAAAFPKPAVVNSVPYSPPMNNGEKFNQQRRWPEAIVEFSRTIALVPDHQGAWRGRAWAQYHLQRWDHAIADFQEALRLEPFDASSQAGLADCLRRKGDLDAAIVGYQSAIQLAPYRAASHYELGLTFAAKRSWDEAIAAYQEALRLKSDYYEAQVALGVAHYRAGAWHEAAALLERAEQITPRGRSFGHSALFLAMSHWQLGNHGQARHWYQHALQWIEANKEALELDGRASEILAVREEAAELLKNQLPAR